MFQSLIGQLQTGLAAIVIGAPLVGFNPLQVSYKRSQLYRYSKLKLRRFNPLQVSYKRGQVASNEILNSRFQSLIGQLQTESSCLLVHCLSWFQSLIGQLQTSLTVTERIPYVLFQSLIGQLQTAGKEVSIVTVAEFQSLIGQLQTNRCL